jgi:hypothetical protein
MTNQKCKWCGERFSTPDGLIQMFTGVAKFCSNKCEHEYNDSNREEEVISYHNHSNPQEDSDWQKWQNDEMSDKVYLNKQNDPNGNLQNYHFQELSKIFAKRPKIISGKNYIDPQGNVYPTSIINGAEWTTTDYCFRDRYKDANVPYDIVPSMQEPWLWGGYPMGYVVRMINPTLKNGWRLPNFNDWNNLVDHFGGDPYASLFLKASEDYQINGVRPDIPHTWANSSEMSFTDHIDYWSFDDRIQYFKFSIDFLGSKSSYTNSDIDSMDEAFLPSAVRLVRDVPSPVQKKKTRGESHAKKKVDKNEKNTELEKLKNLWKSGAISQEQHQTLKEELELQKLNDLLKEGAISQEQFDVLIKSPDTPNKT